MRHLSHRVLVIALALAAIHCGSSQPPPVDAAGVDVPTNTNDAASGGGAIVLNVTSAQYATSIQHTTPSSGNHFLIVGLSLQNVSVATPIGGSPIYFSTGLASHLVVNVTALSAAVPTACRADVSAAVGGTLACSVAFELATTDVPETLAYNDAQGHTANATIPMPQAPVSPLVGTWRLSTTGLPFDETVVFNADGSASSSLTAASGSGCTGSIEYTAATWTATDTMLELSSNWSCASTLMCSANTVACGIGTPPSNSCQYSLNSTNTMLSLSCGGSHYTLTRE